MRKLLGLLALTLAVSGIAVADQDFLKSINFDTNVRYRYQDISGTDANKIGNEGFKQENRVRTRWVKNVSGTVVLSDEWGLEADFWVTHRNQTGRKGHDRTSRYEYWNPGLTLKKNVQLGNLDTTFKFSYENEANRKREGIKEGAYKTESISNEFTLGPEFNVKLLGQDINVDTGLVYFKLNGTADNNLHYSASDTISKKTEGWGLNLNLSTSGTIAEGSYGKFTYGLDFFNKFRDGNGEKFNANGEKEKYGSNVYLDYVQNVKYTSPNFLGGFYGQLTVQNEWERWTATNGWNNYFDVITGLGYKKAFDLSVGTLTVNPYTSYSVVNRETSHKDNRENKRQTIERNEVRAGLKVGLSVK